MSEAIEKMREHFDGKQVPKGSKFLAEERDKVNAMIDAVEAENAKLRELAVDAHACKENDGCCEDCYADEGDCPIELRMRELGIEVRHV